MVPQPCEVVCSFFVSAPHPCGQIRPLQRHGRLVVAEEWFHRHDRAQFRLRHCANDWIPSLRTWPEDHVFIKKELSRIERQADWIIIWNGQKYGSFAGFREIGFNSRSIAARSAVTACSMN